MTSVLLTCAGGLAQVSVIHHLRSLGVHRIVGVDRVGFGAAKGLLDWGSLVPDPATPEYRPTIDRIRREFGVTVTLVCSDGEAVALDPTLATWTDKPRCYRKLEQMGIPVARWLVGGVVKPHTGSGGKGQWAIPRGLVVQQELPGVDWSVDFVADGGVVYGVVPKVRLRTHGASTHAQIIPDEKVTGLVGRVVRQCNLSGLMNIQMRGDGRGELCVYDLNPRIGASAIMGTLAGVDLFGLEIARQTGKPLTPAAPPRDCFIWRHYAETVNPDPLERADECVYS